MRTVRGFAKSSESRSDKALGDETPSRLPIDERFRGIWITLAVLITVVAFTALLPDVRFIRASNIASIAIASATTLVLAIPITMILIAGGIDIATGAMLTLSSVVAANTIATVGGASPTELGVFEDASLGIAVGVLAGLLAGTLCGAFNGLLIAYLRIPAFIATLATMGGYFGLAQVLTGGRNQANIPEVMQDVFGAARIAGVVPIPVAIGLLLALVAWVVLSRTRFGLHVFAIGANMEGARLAGVKVKRSLFWLYTFSGFAAGIAGIIDIGRFRSTSIEAHTLDNLEAITAAVLGGTSLWGGVGGIVGTVVGAFFPSTIKNGFVQMGIQPFWQPVMLGLVLILAVWFDGWRHRNVPDRY